MATLRDIQRRIKSVKNTQQITKAMKMVSAAKLKRAQNDILSARPYARKLTELASSLSESAGEGSNPLLKRPAEGKKAEVILITSDRGLCGGFNAQLIRTADRFIRDNSGLELGLIVIGKRALDHYKGRQTEVLSSRPIGGARPEYALARELAANAIEGYLNGRAGAIYVIYSEFKSALTQKPVVQKLLPITPPEAAGQEEEEKDAGVEAFEKYIFEPSREKLLESILPKFIEVQIFRALLETSASEHGARMTAMDAASRSAADMIDSLTLLYNRARQATITKELMEIIGGAEALKS